MEHVSQEHPNGQQAHVLLAEARVHTSPSSDSGLNGTGTVVFQPLSLSDLIHRPPKEWLVEGVLGPGDLAMIFGPPASAKTFVVVDFILTACLGQPWANRFGVARPLHVAYCAGEGMGGLPARFAAAAAHYGASDLPNFWFFDIMPQLFDPRSPDSVLQFLADWQGQGLGPLDLLVLDTLHSAIVGADENSSRDMGQALLSIKCLAKRLGCAVLLVHHSNRAGTGERGSSAMRGALDVMLEVKPAGSKYSLACAKLKDGEQWRTQTFALVPQAGSARIRWDEPAEEQEDDGRKTQTRHNILALLMKEPARALTSRQIAEALGIAQQNANQVLNALMGEGSVLRREHAGRARWEWQIHPNIVEGGL